MTEQQKAKTMKKALAHAERALKELEAACEALMAAGYEVDADMAVQAIRKTDLLRQLCEAGQ